MADAWMGAVVNLANSDDPVETAPYRDIKASKLAVSCLSPFGAYGGGSVIMRELNMVIELYPGELLFFPDALITHSNEPEQGDRNSVMAFTQQNMFEYWRSTWGQQVAMFGKRARKMEKVKTKWKKARTERGMQKSEKV
jgi:hypothetical protein